jgi:ubiquinone/menaquinone biosynthesis C-methylase UbiE
MTTFDVYGATNTLPDPILEAIATRLEARGRHPAMHRMLDEYLAAMAIDHAKQVLVVGSGTGVVPRHLTARADFTGSVVAIDQSPYLVEVARRLVTEEGVGERIRFAVGDAQRLDLPESTFDAVIAHTVISHVPDPRAVLAEARRVVRPGGTVAIFDGDYASLTFGQPDPVQGKRDDEAIQAAMVAQPRVMRQMPLLLHEAQLTLLAGLPSVVADIGTADFFAPGLTSFRRLLPQAGAMDEVTANAWVEARLQESATGTFFGASSFYAYLARRDA